MARFCEGNIGTSDGGLCLGMPGLEYNEYGCERCHKCATYVSDDWYEPSDDCEEDDDGEEE